MRAKVANYKFNGNCQHINMIRKGKSVRKICAANQLGIHVCNKLFMEVPFTEMN